jgi:hypothetical protein
LDPSLRKRIREKQAEKRSLARAQKAEDARHQSQKHRLLIRGRELAREIELLGKVDAL